MHFVSLFVLTFLCQQAFSTTHPGRESLFEKRGEQEAAVKRLEQRQDGWGKGGGEWNGGGEWGGDGSIPVVSIEEECDTLTIGGTAQPAAASGIIISEPIFTITESLGIPADLSSILGGIYTSNLVPTLTSQQVISTTCPQVSAVVSYVTVQQTVTVTVTPSFSLISSLLTSTTLAAANATTLRSATIAATNRTMTLSSTTKPMILSTGATAHPTSMNLTMTGVKPTLSVSSAKNATITTPSLTRPPMVTGSMSSVDVFTLSLSKISPIPSNLTATAVPAGAAQQTRNAAPRASAGCSALAAAAIAVIVGVYLPT